ncbi:hypothetical protein BDV28DRAFT_135859 [Aspergillus coremiiformis]|uniref:Uncharacterized protein n=1 Tax=Aspergillus coremiiformis TaxID=138285 RepID=A0A5N6Z7M2_9EURO|nr:hypothetical protein BDV28DRAFT_135859 [Aspergillus coremiiformis]
MDLMQVAVRPVNTPYWAPWPSRSPVHATMRRQSESQEQDTLANVSRILWALALLWLIGWWYSWCDHVRCSVRSFALL